MSQNNLPSITVDTFCKIVEMQFKEKNFRPIFGLGKGGIGKTESIADLAKKLNVGYIDIRLLLYGETDLKGIPYPDQNHIKTVWLQNNILPTVERDGEEGILVFDEITSCSKSVRTAAYQLLNERRLGEFVLPNGWLVVCLGNGEDDGGDYQGMEGNFVNRCSVFNVVPSLTAWKLWANKKGINELVLAYVSFKPSDLHSFDPESTTELLFASPRSWKAVSDILNIYGFQDGDVVLNSRIIANLGLRVGQQFMSFCKFKDETVDPEKIIKNGERPNIQKQEVILITLQSVIKLLTDMVTQDIQFNNGAISMQTLEYLSNTVKWILSLPKKEYMIMGLKDLLAHDEVTYRKCFMSPQLAQLCPELFDFARKNQEIFN